MVNATFVFVHGLGGDSATTWGRFEELILADTDMKGCESVSFGYPTSLFRWPFSQKYPKIQTLADALRTQLDVRFGDRQDLILVCHSLGGLIGRRYLVDEVKRKAKLRVRGLLLYAVPNDGAGLAGIADHISWRHNQLKQLCQDSDLIRDLDSDWATSEMAQRVKVRYVVGGQDSVVSEKSARSSWGEPNVDVVADRGHIEIVKPLSGDDLPYLIFKKFALSMISAPPNPTETVARYATPLAARHPIQSPPKGPYRVIAFDLDGTLLRGIDFSWTVVWKHLGFSEAVYKGAMRDYRKGKTTYQEWCELACAHFRAKGLRRSDFANIVSGVTVTNNLQETLATLKASGFVLALISGGIDTFIEEKIPNAAEMFDYICINRIRYDQPSGLISGVDATPFDFEGKTVALEAICKRHGCTLKEAVFVGEGFNDENVITKAGLSIAYPPGETAIEAASISVKEDDLSKILEHVL
jgi:phosphoserine phosphatase/predicted alpha/beta hydrolase family esterase